MTTKTHLECSACGNKRTLEIDVIATVVYIPPCEKCGGIMRVIEVIPE